MLLLRYVPLHLSLSLTLGILVGYFWRQPPEARPMVFAGLLVLVGFGWIWQQRSYGLQPLFFLSAHFFMAFFGYYLVGRELPGGRSGHYRNHYEQGDCYCLELKRERKTYGARKRFEAEVVRVGKVPTSGKVYVSFASSSLSDSLELNDLLASCSGLKEIIRSGNPGSFDFKNYAQKKGITDQVFMEEGSYVYAGKARPSLYSLASSWNRKVGARLDTLGLATESLALLKALLLGDKTGMPEELSEDFRGAGAAHILALSGLHVGILIGMIRLFLFPLGRLLGSVWMVPIAELFLLWTFVLLTGLSASVIRAVSMYSIYLVIKRLSREMAGGAVIVLAFFFMLLLRPLFLFDTGFQLSFAAVAGILLIHPLCKGLWLPKSTILRRPVELLYVSLGAQLGVLPLILLYFHQFSGHFLFSSLALIPSLGLLIPYGLTTLVFSFFLPVPDVMLQSLEFIMRLLRGFVGWLAQFKILLWQQVYFTKYLAITLYGFLLTLFSMVSMPARKLLYALLAFIVLFEGQLVYDRYTYRNSGEVLVAQAPGSSLVTCRRGSTLNLYRSSSGGKDKTQSTLEAYLGTFPMSSKIVDKGQAELFYFNDLLVRLVGRDHLVLEDKAETEIVILHDSPRVHLEKLIRCYKPRIIVADGSNYPSFVSRWKNTCQKFKVIFHDTRKQGAFVYRKGYAD